MNHIIFELPNILFTIRQEQLSKSRLLIILKPAIIFLP
jgi:hypothetical protein